MEKKRRGDEGGLGWWSGRGGSSGANHVNLKQATNPGGFLFLCGAMPYCHLFFHFSTRGNLTSSVALPPCRFLPSPMCNVACLFTPVVYIHCGCELQGVDSCPPPPLSCTQSPRLLLSNVIQLPASTYLLINRSLIRLKSNNTTLPERSKCIT